MPKFYYYIVVVYMAENPYIAPPAVTTENRSLFSMKRLWDKQELLQGVVISL